MKLIQICLTFAAVTFLGLAASAVTCNNILDKIMDRPYLASIPDSGPVISKMPDVLKKVRIINNDSTLSDEGKAKGITDLYFSRRISLLPPYVRPVAEFAMSNVQILPKLSFLAEIQDVFSQREGAPPIASHVSDTKISITEEFIILRIVYGAVAAHELAHVIQLNSELQESKTLSLLDTALNPIPRNGRRSVRREEGAFAEQWDFLQLFDRVYRERAIQNIQDSDLATTDKRIIIQSLNFANLPRDQFIQQMKRLNNHTNLHEYAGELIFKASIYAGILAALFYYF